MLKSKFTKFSEDKDNFIIFVAYFTDTMFLESITNEDIATMPTLAFTGRIVLIEDMVSQEEAAADLLRCNFVGFDTESRASFKKGERNSIALLQLSTSETSYLIRLNRTKLSKGIIKVLQSKRVKKIGVAVRDDIKELQTIAPFYSNGFVDLQKEVGEYGIRDISLKKMAAIILGGRVSKAQRLSNWAAQNLTELQQSYAATDAWVCLKMYDRLTKEPKKEKE